VVDAFLVQDINANKQGKCSANGNTQNVDDGKQLVFGQMPQRNGDIIFKHMLSITGM
jgi:hypothetical protein